MVCAMMPLMISSTSVSKRCLILGWDSMKETHCGRGSLATRDLVTEITLNGAGLPSRHEA